MGSTAVSLMEADMEEGEDPGGGEGGECCRALVKVLRKEFEEKFKELETRMAAKEQDLVKYVDDLREIITVREEQVIATMATVKEREEEINELKDEVQMREKIIEELRGELDARHQECMPKQKKKIQAPKQRPQNERSLESIFGGGTFSKYFVINWKNENDKRKLCPYQVEADVMRKLAGKPRSIMGSGRNGLLVEVSSEEQSRTIMDIKDILSMECNVRPQDFFNETRGVIYIYDSEITDIESFQEGLQERYPIVSVAKANWITPRNSRATPFMIKFRGEACPDYITIPGEHLMTKVYEYKERPLQCRKCQKYGHVQKRCSATSYTCGSCAQDHPTDQCTVETKLCANCSEPHKTTDATCKIREREIQVIEIQKKEKVGRRRAKDIQAGKQVGEEYLENQQYERYMHVKISRDETRKICPFVIEKFFNSKFGINKKEVTSIRDGYILKATTAQQVDQISKITNVYDIPCEVTDNSSMLARYNSSKGLIYVNDYDVTNTTSFEEGLKRQYNICQVTPATWIKTKNINSTPFLITFAQSTLPTQIHIPGEQSATQVYRYRPRPLFCLQCLEYGHTNKRCNNAVRCRMCGGTHKSTECEQRTPSCHHCKGEHYPGSKECPKQKEEEEICEIQHKDKIDRSRARQKYMTSREGKTYAAQVKVKKTVKEVRTIKDDRREREREVDQHEEASERRGRE